LGCSIIGLSNCYSRPVLTKLEIFAGICGNALLLMAKLQKMTTDIEGNFYEGSLFACAAFRRAANGSGFSPLKSSQAYSSSQK